MSRADRQQNVLDLLNQLRGLEPLKRLFWSELNYQRVNQPLSRRGWPEPAIKALADDPVLFAGGGEDGAFHVIYCRLASNGLPRGLERPVVTRLSREHPYALFVISNKAQTDWHFLNVKFDEKTEKRRLFRRITVRPDAGLRTATERLQLLDLAEIDPDLSGIAPLAIQQRCDAAFDVETVTKDFFREVANWYFWALKKASFPKDAPKEADGHDHISIIRLITRLIFCWFVKEKGLIPGGLFDERQLSRMLADFAPDKSSDKGSVFYKAILQNLFFATLNTEMDKRGWRREEQNFMAHTLYRHRDLFQKPAEALDLFKNIPFLNGGLFECLDRDLGENAKPRYIRIDGFSDRADSQPTVPDFLFFGSEREVDLSADYGDKKFKRVLVRGLIHTFNRYNFTVEEDTPIDQEVALDPELSGKVFENLLAAYNPETGATARKQTGSFYTPREIVNYMVDEALIACLKTKLTAENAKNAKTEGKQAETSSSALSAFSAVEEKLRHLFAYNDPPSPEGYGEAGEPHQFTPREVDALIAAIDSLKTLDPAVGSGAFPMGILHKLVFILGKLDPHNRQWKQKQIEKAAEIPDATVREKTLEDIEKAFAENELDYGRKLYLIENCIYGVDIQPIAVQIAKMRFFISLIVDQKIDDAHPNRGVRPLPNLETKFVAANTLIGVNRPGQQLLRNRDIDAKEAELRRVRERHFNARTPKQKAKCREEDARLRAEIAELLKGDGWDTATARRLAAWNPYDQNASADFFDSEWMFGLTSGFHIVVGNPPYGASITEEQKRYFNAAYIHQDYQLDSYILFIEKCFGLSMPAGSVALIIPNTWLLNLLSKKLRKWIFTEKAIRAIVHFTTSVFAAVVDNEVVILTNAPPPANHRLHVTVFGDSGPSSPFSVPQDRWRRREGDAVNVLEKPEFSQLTDKLRAFPVLDSIAVITQGAKPFQVGKGNPPQTRAVVDSKPFVATEKKNKTFRPLLRGSLMQRYMILWNDDYWISLGDWLAEPRYSANYDASEKIVIRQTGDSLVATLDDRQFVVRDNLYTIVSRDRRIDLRFILGLLNSRLLNWFYQNALNPEKGEALAQVKRGHIAQLPIALPNRNADNQFVMLVDRILKTKQKNPAADTSALEREIDQEVYALYGLTPEEIKIVEESCK